MLHPFGNPSHSNTDNRGYTQFASERNPRTSQLLSAKQHDSQPTVFAGRKVTQTHP